MELKMNSSDIHVQNISTNGSVLDDLLFPNTSSSPDPNAAAKERLQALQNIMFSIQYVILPFFLITGLFGNTFTIITMASKRFQHLTSRYILIFLAMSDTILLLSQPFNKLWVITFFGVDLRALSETNCKVFFVIFRTAKMTSSWLVVLLCFERFVAVVYPLQVKRVLRKRFILPAIAVDYIFMFIYNGVWSYSSGIVNGFCKPDLPSIQHSIFVIVGCSFYSFIPTVLLLFFTPLIIGRLIRQRNIRKKMTRAVSLMRSSTVRKNGGTAATSNTNKAEDEMLRASVMVLGVMIAYIILIIPITTVHLYSFIVGVSAFDVNNYGFFIYREVAQMLEQVNYAVNFFFYILCSRTFRGRVQELLCIGRRVSSLTGRSSENNSSMSRSNLTKTISA